MCNTNLCIIFLFFFSLLNCSFKRIISTLCLMHTSDKIVSLILSPCRLKRIGTHFLFLPLFLIIIFGLSVQFLLHLLQLILLFTFSAMPIWMVSSVYYCLRLFLLVIYFPFHFMPTYRSIYCYRCSVLSLCRLNSIEFVMCVLVFSLVFMRVLFAALLRLSDTFGIILLYGIVLQIYLNNVSL